MTILDLKSIGTETTEGLMSTVRSWLDKSNLGSGSSSVTARSKSIAEDRARYASLLGEELDNEALSDMEREDREALARVRAALYADE